MAHKPYTSEPDVMSASDTACDYARKIIGREAGGGGVESAMNRLEAKTGIGFWTWRSLWYGRPKQISHELFERVRGAYVALRERDLATLQHDLEVEKMRRVNGTDPDLVAEVEALAREAEALAQRLKAARGR